MTAPAGQARASDARIRDGVASDTAALTALALAAKAHWGYPASWIESWRDELTLRPADVAATTVRVVDDAGGPMAFAAVAPGQDGVWTLAHLWVRPDRIGHGLGAALLDDALAIARRGGARAVVVESDPNAEGFYVRAGFTRVGAKPAAMPGAPERALPILRIELAGRAPSADDQARGEYVVSFDVSRIDVAAVHASLGRSYWAAGIPREIVQRAIDGSLCVGLYHRGAQVGFARAVTDRATFAYLADVYVLEEHRGQGLAKWLVGALLGHPDMQGLRRVQLFTREAHGLYRKLGFAETANPGGLMEIVQRDLYRGGAR